jgi:hypothetical protein
MNRAEGRFGPGVEGIEYFVPAQPGRRPRAVRLHGGVGQRIRVAVAQAKLAFEHVPYLAMLGQPALFHESGELGKALAGLGLDVVDLGLDGLV